MAQVPGMPTVQDLATGGSYFQAPIGNERQQQIQNQTGELGIQRLANPQAGFDPIAANARNEFYSDVVPGLAERFTAMGGGQRSSGFQRAVGRAGSNLEQNLAAQGAQYGLQQQGLALNQVNTGLQPQYSQAYYQPQDNQLGGQLASAGGDLVNAYLKAPGDTPLDKAKSVLGLATDAGKVAKGAVQGATQSSIEPAAVTAQKVVGAGKDLAEIAAPAVGSGIAAGASKIAGTNPALASTIASKATAGTAAKTAATAGGVKAFEASIAPALAKFGAVAMPLVALPLMGWIGYEIIKGLYDEFKEEPLF